MFCKMTNAFSIKLQNQILLCYLKTHVGEIHGRLDRGVVRRGGVNFFDRPGKWWLLKIIVIVIVFNLIYLEVELVVIKHVCC